MVFEKKIYYQGVNTNQLKILLGLFITILTLVVYGQVVNFEFVVYDDGLYVTANRHVQKGLTLKNVAWAFTDTHTGNWHPITWLSHMLDVHLFDMDAGKHHLINLFIHIANAVLLFWIFEKMSGLTWPSAVTAAIFAIHPLHVESVAWISERKDVLSTFFWLLSMQAYIYYTKNPGIKRYLLITVFFVMGLLTKPMLVTFPLVLLLIDYWPLNRFPSESHSVFKRFFKTNVLLEKIPLLVLAGGASLVALFSQKSIETVASFDLFPIHVRLANALVSYCTYAFKTIWPAKLAVFYPHSGLPPVWQIIAASSLLIGVSLYAMRTASKRPWFMVGWFWYLGTLVPVIGLVQVGLQAMADRYTYIPQIGLLIMAGYGWHAFFSNGSFTQEWHRYWGSRIAAVLIILVLSVFSWRQISYWENSLRLFEHTLEVTEDNFVAHNVLGNVWAQKGRFNTAKKHYSEALRIRPRYAEAHYNLGHALYSQEKIKEAIHHFSEALRIKPHYAPAHNYLGYLFLQRGNFDKSAYHIAAAVRYAAAMRYDPELALAYYNTGVLHYRLGKIDLAIKYLNKTVDLRPDYFYAYEKLGDIFVEHEQVDQAIDAYFKVIELNPRHAGAHYKLGILFEQKKNVTQAIEHFKTAVMLKPDFTSARRKLNRMLNPETNIKTP